MMKRPIELLSPAGNLQTAKAAILAGADSVYMGAPRFGARSAVGNTVEAFEELCKFAHIYGCKVYAALNTILTDAELPQAVAISNALWNAGIDALIVQDLGLMSALPKNIRVHASTQCHISTPEKAKFIESIGFETIVLARELSLKEISEISDNLNCGIECFVHGALCVSYSGQCYLSHYIGGRSGNRGECAQPCRMKYKLLDTNGREVAPPAYYLSLKDMKRIDRLGEMLDAGVSVFKIEGRLKDENYVKNTTAAYRASLDMQLQKRGLKRASFGTSKYSFTPDLKKTFSRLFTDYHLDGISRGCSSFTTPKARGEFIGKVKKTFSGGFFFENADDVFSNGDGLFFETPNDNGFGASVSKINGDKVFVGKPNDAIKIPQNAVIWRNKNCAFENSLSRKIERRMPVQICVSDTQDNFVFSIKTDDSRQIIYNFTLKKSTTVLAENFDTAKDKISDALCKLGATPFLANSAKIESNRLPHLKISEINDIRRSLVSGLENAIISEYENKRKQYQRKSPTPIEFTTPPFDSDARANVLNKKAEDFYKSYSVKISAYAPESKEPTPQGFPLMKTRHCILRELNLCKKDGKFPKDFKEPFYLESSDTRLKLHFDCASCHNIITEA